MLKKWLQDNPKPVGSEFTYKGKAIKINGNRFNCKDCNDLNSLQYMHLNGEIDLYLPIEAYAEDWDHVTDKEGKFVSATPKVGTRRRNDLPPVYMQWKKEFNKGA